MKEQNLQKKEEKVGVNDGEDPPVPIPNTVVKLVSAENTWLETTREDRSMPTLSLSDAYRAGKFAPCQKARGFFCFIYVF